MEMETLISALDKHDELLRCVAAGRLGLVDFLAQYDNFYWAYALDGHEAEPDAAALAALSNRIEPHRHVAEDVLAVLAAEPTASQPTYISAGRIGPTETIDRLKLITQALPARGA